MRDAPSRDQSATVIPLWDPEQREQRRARQRRRWQHVIAELTRDRELLAQGRPDQPAERTA
jgi:hypothetical protein